MSLLLSLLPASILAAVGYVILYCSMKVNGQVKIFGQVLAVVLFVLAVFPLVLGAYLTSAGISPSDMMAQHMSSFQK